MSYPTFQIVDSDLTTVLFDCNNGTTTRVLPTGFDPGSARNDLSTIRGSHSGSLLTRKFSDSTTFSWEQAIMGGSVSATLDLYGTLTRLLDDEGLLKIQLTASAPIRYIEYLGTTDLPGLFRGRYGIPAQQLTMGGLAEGFPVSVERQPWVLGAEITSSPIAVSNDPASGTNRLSMPVTIDGDLPVPLDLTIASSAARARYILSYTTDALATWGDAGVLSKQAESGTLTNDTASTVEAGTSSGSVAATSFATVSTNATRVAHTYTLADLKGYSFDVYARVRKTTGADEIKVSVSHAGSESPQVTVPGTDTDFRFVKTGRISVSQAAFEAYAINLRAQRVTGAGSLHWDYTVLVPVADHLSLWSWPTSASGDLRFDAQQRVARVAALDERVSHSGPFAIHARTGRLMVIPYGADAQLLAAHMGATSTVTYSYRPRYVL